MHRQVGLILGLVGVVAGFFAQSHDAWAQIPDEQGVESVCIHDDVQGQVVMRRATPSAVRAFQAPEVLALSTPATSPIRITLDTSLLASSTLSAGEKVQFETLARNAADWFESILEVVPVVGDLSINGNCSGEGPAANVTESNSDFLVLLSGVPIASSSTVAWATFCQTDAYGRPLIGQLNVNPARINTDPDEAEFFEDVFTHELLHALGFSVAAFTTFRDGLEGPLRTDVITPSYLQGGKMVTAMVTPTVVSAARDHVDCPSLVGAEIEDGGGDGTAGSHWEQRIYLREIMSPVISSLTVPSRSLLTLALLHDSGWYQVDLSKADPYLYGQGEGCGFAQSTCGDEAAFSDRYFCDGSIASSCTVDRLAQAGCDDATYGSDLPAHFQYFADPRKGGLEVADFCPVWNAFNNGLCDDPDNAPGQVPTPYGESFTSSSYCFDSTLLDDDYIFNPADPAAGKCHEVSCGASTLSIKVGLTWKECPALGGEVNVTGYEGSLSCPPFDEFCSVCGDDLINNGETCDDGDAAGGDGCDASCQVEDGYYCLGVPSVCNPLPVPEPSLLVLQGLALLTLSGLGRTRRS